MSIYTKIKFLELAQISNDYECACNFPWIGGVIDDPIACTYKWVDGTPFDYDNFYSTEPNCVGVSCIQFYTDHTAATNPPVKGFWSDATCTIVSRAYICKKPRKMISTQSINVCPSGWDYYYETQSCYKVI
jgi:hypothetical protein